MNKKRLLQYKTHLDTCAEIGWQEKQTTQYIKQCFPRIKPILDGFGESKTGLLYKIGGGKQAILFRADIDALQTQFGPRHTCGHSSHTAALMETMHEIFAYEERLTKNNKAIYILFQPAEETYPSGAKAFLDSSTEYIKQIRFAFAAHVRPLLPLATVGLKTGPLWARGDYMEIEITGKMVHIKDAPQGNDAIEAGANIILLVKNLQKTYNDSIRINIGVMQGGLQANTVADKAFLKGDIRLKEDTMQKEIRDFLQKEIKNIATATNTSITFTYFDGYPVVMNNDVLTKSITTHFRKTNTWKIKSDESLFTFGCEDFCFIAEKIPSVMALIGTGDSHDIHELACTISDEGTERIYMYFSSIARWWLKISQSA